ncbi:thiol-disulfide oxidoreductase DCC family protein [Ureibacillus sinduriensis]|uniref:Thiol-disulfide oxidoreductase n=1 Tax=Ureibacillus sinduriensis BLB-1 = JCM 15800 TaxID=1384057 RepID=A0A0A3HPX4_9BACL|nr:DCC1-like thiol-disulfide oxidoreductase family protein [Ureibacillus sinduriensis]KGR74444.1 thiol-disulfide oxidoreductase [Ureibacillus sinduriensis BLB-1 = JCM 15800]
MNIILFDGECHFCDASVQFIMKRDRRKYFKFASIQSDIGQRLLEEFNIPETIDSVVFIEGKKSYVKSTAALKICSRLDGMWRLFSPFLIIPKKFRDAIYDIVAKNRHKLSKKNECKIPTKDELERFLH